MIQDQVGDVDITLDRRATASKEEQERKRKAESDLDAEDSDEQRCGTTIAEVVDIMYHTHICERLCNDVYGMRKAAIDVGRQ